LAIQPTALAGAIEFEMPLVKIVLLCMEARFSGGDVQLSNEHDDFAWAPLSSLLTFDLTDHVKPFMVAYSQRPPAS
jgi:hypothetical protein